MSRLLAISSFCMVVLGLCACSGATNPAGVSSLAHAGAVRGGGSLGPVLTTSDGGQIFGFDIDQNGNDGVLTSASYTEISVQTFDETTGKIAKTIGSIEGKKVAKATTTSTTVSSRTTSDWWIFKRRKAGADPGKRHVPSPESGDDESAQRKVDASAQAL